MVATLSQCTALRPIAWTPTALRPIADVELLADSEQEVYEWEKAEQMFMAARQTEEWQTNKHRSEQQEAEDSV